MKFSQIFLIMVALGFIACSSPALADNKLFMLQDQCIKCHLWSESSAGENSVVKWKNSVHFTPGSACADCHGGDRLYYMDFKKGHMGIPDTNQSVAMCEQCHQQEVRDYIDRKVHINGKKSCTVSCVDCHGHHQVEQADGYLINPGTCGKCHDPAKAAALYPAIDSVEKALSELESDLEREKIAGAPVLSTENSLTQLRRDYARAFHKQTMGDLHLYLTQELPASIEGLGTDETMSASKRWNLQGMGILAFLAITAALLALYIRSLHNQKS